MHENEDVTMLATEGIRPVYIHMHVHVPYLQQELYLSDISDNI